MILDITFNENQKQIPIDLQENLESLDSDVGEVVVVHDGQNGATFTPHVSADGVISWTNDRELDNPQPINIRGKDGADGKDGYTPIKGVDYFDGKDGVDGKDGYTPVKGVDYFDGKNGIDGKDGYTPVKGKDYFDGKNGIDGYTPVKGKDYFDGADGKDGQDGKTPVKGTDYFTEADKAEMVSAVISALPKYNGEVVSV